MVEAKHSAAGPMHGTGNRRGVKSVQCIQRDLARDLLQRGLNGRERLTARGRHAARLVRAPVCALTLLAAVLDTLAACTPLERRVDTTTVSTPHTHPAVVERHAAAP
jgi:hypothetical protein